MTKVNKKKTLAIAAVLGLGALALGGGSLAYFSDTDTDINTFTVGNIKIDLLEKQRVVDDEGNVTTELEDFEQNKTLLPFVGNENGGPVDSLGMTTGKNYGDKMVSVKNTGKNKAYIRAYVAVPADVDFSDAAENYLHFNFGRDANGVKTNDGGTGDWLWKDANVAYKTNSQTVTIKSVDGQETTDGNFTVYQADYKEALAAGAETPRLLNGAYLDSYIDVITVSDADPTTGAVTTTLCKNTTNCVDLNYDINKFGLQIPVYIVAVQADGFDSADAAFAAAFDTIDAAADRDDWLIVAITPTPSSRTRS